MEELNCYLTYEDSRYPLLIIQGNFGSVGYSLNKDTEDLRRICICSAYSESECMCGAWNELE